MFSWTTRKIDHLSVLSVCNKTKAIGNYVCLVNYAIYNYRLRSFSISQYKITMQIFFSAIKTESTKFLSYNHLTRFINIYKNMHHYQTHYSNGLSKHINIRRDNTDWLVNHSSISRAVNTWKCQKVSESKNSIS